MQDTMSKVREKSDHELPDILARNMDEVNENPETLEEDIKEFRNLILEDKELDAKLDDEFLLRFLRARKFDKQKALTLIQDYYKIRYRHRNLFQDAKPSLLRHAFEYNLLTFLPHRDNLGRRIVIFKAANWDPALVKSEHVILAVSIALEKIIQEKETQLCGVCGIIDAKDSTFYQARHISITDIRNSTAMNLLYLHGSDYSSLHKHIPAAYLPEEYGGSQPPIDNTSFYQGLLDSEEYFEDQLTFGYGKK